MRVRAFRIFVSLSVAMIAASALADKLADFGLDSRGKPIGREERQPPVPSIVLPGAGGYSKLARPELAASGSADVAERARLISKLIVAGPTAEERKLGASTPLPAGTSLTDVIVSGDSVKILLDLPEDFVTSATRVADKFDAISDAFIRNLQQLPLRSFEVLARKPGSSDYLPLDRFLPKEAAPEVDLTPDTATPPALPEADITTRSQEARLNQYPRPAGSRPVGALTGKAVYLNPGHGWDWRESDYWGLQRGFVQNNIEDFSNVELINQWLWAYCYNAGADVFSCRELDFNTNMVIVDNDDGWDGSKGYYETGSGWFNSTLKGFANGYIPYLSGADPFSSGTNRLVQCVVGTPTASARWVPEIPASGWYNVYVSHGAFSNRSPQAHYRIYHAGGVTETTIDQRMRRFTWIYLGTFYFEAGVDAQHASVELLNDSSSTSHYVSADAVRFGGGMGLISRGTAGTSGKPRFEEEARYHIQFSGAPTSVYDSSSSDQADGWSGRPKFGRWLRDAAVAYGAPAQDSVFISSHTNAFDGTARGLDTYVYTGYEGTWHDQFRNFVHDEVLNDCQKGYSSLFVNHGVGKRYGTYGENNPSNVGDLMPIFLGEWLFHDNATDMSLYHDPKFRQVMARAIYQGIVKFWANRNGTTVNLLPEPPRNVRVQQLSSTSVRISWDQPQTDTQGIRGDAATGYALYVSSHGRSFPAPITISGGSTTNYVLSGITPDTTYFFYLTARNAGGESFPTETLAFRTSVDPMAPKLLIVNGFDKLDIATRQAVPWSGGTLYRQRLAKMNTYDYIVEHARAIEQWGKSVAFDSCEDEAVELDYVTLGGYGGVVWIGGIQAEVSTTDPTNDISISAAQQTRLTNYLNSGGKLFLSGSEIAWDLDRAGTTTFVDNTLRANYVADSAGVFSASGASGSIFAGITGINFDDGSGPTYKVNYPDVITNTGGSIAALTYGGGETLIDGFNDLGGWKDPNYSSQTTADAASSFAIVSSPVLEGSGSGDLYYVWGSGSYIREYNSTLPEFPANSTFSIWVYGDNSGHQVRICLRDSDNELYVNDWVTINFSGWRQLTWNIPTDPRTVWANVANNTLDGPNVKLDSIHVQKVTGVASGHLYFDKASYTSLQGGGSVAGVQYAGTYKLVYLAFPFETIVSESKRNQLMARALDFFFPTVVSTARVEPLTTATGWMVLAQTPSDAASLSYDAANTALRGTVSSDPTRFRIAGWMTDQSKWLPYSTVGTNQYVRGKFYVYCGGQTNPAQTNQIPAARMRLSIRFAQNSMLEVFNHTNLSASDELLERELRPSSDPTKPSLYRVDFDPVDVPYLVANAATEGIAQGFETYAYFPQDNGYLALTELSLGTYPVTEVPNSVAPAKIYATSASDAGDLSAARSGAILELYSIIFGAEGSYGTRDNSYGPTYSESAAGVTVSSRGFDNYRGGTRLAVATLDFAADSDLTARVRVEPARQYKIRFHVTSSQDSNKNPQLRLRARSIRFAWSQKMEVGGAFAAGAVNNLIAAQSLPGVGCLNPDKNPGDTAGGWYTMIFHTPMSLDIRPEVSGDLSARMPNISAEPGPGQNAISRRDLRVGFDLLDTLSPPPNAVFEEGDFTLDRIEVRSYPLVRD